MKQKDFKEKKNSDEVIFLLFRKIYKSLPYKKQTIFIFWIIKTYVIQKDTVDNTETQVSQKVIVARNY